MTDSMRSEFASEKDLPDFSGKLVLFYTRDAPRGIQDGVLMKFISFTQYGDQLFLTGRQARVDKNGIDWTPNMQAAICWNDVTHFVVFDSQEDYLSHKRRSDQSFFRRMLG